MAAKKLFTQIFIYFSKPLRLLYFTQIFIYFSKPLRLLYSLIIYEIVNFSFFTLYSLLLLSFFLYLKSVPIYVIVHVLKRGPDIKSNDLKKRRDSYMFGC